MTDDKLALPTMKGITVKSIYESELLDPETEASINQAVAEIILMDDRFHKPDIEILDALRDWVRAEAIVARAFDLFMKNDTTASTERMFRHASLHKNALRDEIFGKFRGRRAKKEEVDYANKILVDTGVIKPNTEVDILAD